MISSYCCRQCKLKYVTVLEKAIYDKGLCLSSHSRANEAVFFNFTIESPSIAVFSECNTPLRNRQRRRPMGGRTSSRALQWNKCGGGAALIWELALGFTASSALVPLAQVIRLRMREERGGEGKREGNAPMEKCPGLG